MNKFKLLSVLLIVLVFPLFMFACSNEDDKKPKGYYLGETMSYDDIDVRVDSVTETTYYVESTKESGYLVKVTFTLKNNKTKEFSVDDDCFDIRTEDKNQKYETEQILFYRSIIAGGQETYWLEFKVPYSINEKNYIMYFDWGWTHKEQAYHLYKRSFTQEVLDYELSADSSYYIVKGIGGCKNHTSITIPASYNNLPIKSIYTKAFYKNNNITSVNINSNVEEIQDRAFYECPNLQTITLNEGLKYIRANAFGNCEKITELNIPSTVIEITGDQFMPNLNKINISSIESWCRINFETYSNPLRHAKYLYLNNELFEDLEIPNTIDSIGSYAFDGCENLKSVIIPNSIVRIGYQVFGNCTNLESITLPFTGHNVNPEYGTEFRYIFGSDSNSLPVSLKNVTLTNGSTIKRGTFSNCKHLTNITLPSTIETIENSSFDGCSSLVNINIPNTIRDISGSSFTGCNNLTYNMFGGVKYLGNTSNPYLVAYDFESSETEITLHDNCSCIASGAFLDSANITKVIMSDNIKHIGNSAFKGCLKLSNISLSNSMTKLNSSLFENCSALQNINLTNNITHIGSAVFKGCTSLESVQIPTTVTIISDSLFTGCSSLKTVILHDDITSIGTYAFKDCISIKSLTLPQNLSHAGSYAFTNCNSLESINISKSLTLFSACVFQDCTKLKTINYAGTITEWNSIEKTTGYHYYIRQDWDWGTPSYVVYCSDGTLNKG